MKMSFNKAGILARQFVLVIYQGCGTNEQKVALRNELLSPYFKARVKRLVRNEEANCWAAEYENPEEPDLSDAHAWYNGITTAVRRATGEFDEEVLAAQAYIYQRPPTATV